MGFWYDSFMGFNNFNRSNWNNLGDGPMAPLLSSTRCKPGSKLKDAPLFLDHMQLIQKVREFWMTVFLHFLDILGKFFRG